MVNMKYGGRYWFHCESCDKDQHRDPLSVAPMPKHWFEFRKTIKSGLSYPAVVCEDCAGPEYWA